MTIKYLVCMVLVFQSSLTQDAIERPRSNVILWMTSNRHTSRFGRMFELAMAAFLCGHYPTITFNYTLNFTNSHELPMLLVDE